MGNQKMALKGGMNLEFDFGKNRIFISVYDELLCYVDMDEWQDAYFKMAELKANLDCQKIASVSDQIKENFLKIMKGEQ